MADQDFVPYIPAEKIMPEFTAKMIVVGVILTIVMAAANAYLGLFAGMTVSATIPAVVMALAVLRPLKGTILEINLSKAMAVTGEALAAGVIFTFPALLVLYHLTDGTSGWETLMTHWPEMIVGSLIGGVLGILFTIPLRKVLIIDLALPYPEGVASAEVLKAMERGGKGMNLITYSLIIGLLFKISSSHFGLRLWQEKIEGAAPNEGFARMPYGLGLSPALLGVGYILGPNIAVLVFSGGVLGWLVLVPTIALVVGWPAPGWEGVYRIWFDYTMYVGIGAIVTGGIYTLIKLREPIMKGIKDVIAGQRKGTGKEVVKPIRTEWDFPFQIWYFVAIAISMVLLYYFVTYSIVVSVVSMVVLFVACFFFTAVAGYLAGVIGSSNNPISGVTVATLLFTAIILLGFSAGGFISTSVGMTATIVVGAVVCVSAAIAGDSMQELKTGQLIGATPYWIQISRFIGVLVAAILVPFVVAALAQAYGIAVVTEEHPNPLAAPQAMVMAQISLGIFAGQINIAMFLLGVGIGIILIFMKKPVMAIAIGIYLPFTLVLPIMLGGIIKWMTDGYVSRKIHRYGPSQRDIDLITDTEEGLKEFKDTKPTDTEFTIPADKEARARSMSMEEKGKIIDALKEKINSNGILFASGLVAGEAIMGVMIAVIVIMGLDISVFGIPAAWPGLLLFTYIGFLICYMLLREFVTDMSFGEITRIIKDEIRVFIDSMFRFFGMR
jgi:putative OPT family oligopeptide transporter